MAIKLKGMPKVPPKKKMKDMPISTNIEDRRAEGKQRLEDIALAKAKKQPFLEDGKILYGTRKYKYNNKARPDNPKMVVKKTPVGEVMKLGKKLRTYNRKGK